MGAGALFAAGTALSVYGQYTSARAQKNALNEQAASFAREQQILEVQQQITDNQYSDKRRQVVGAYEAAAGHGGVKLTGSVAESLSQSLEQLNMEQAYAKFDNQMSIISANASANAARRNASAAMTAGYINMGATALQGAATSMYYWGGSSSGKYPVRDVTNTAGTGGNVTITNASYRG